MFEFVSKFFYPLHICREVTLSNIKLFDLSRLNRPHEAMKDADRAKKFNPGSSCAIMAKAESFYNMGKFEMALG